VREVIARTHGVLSIKDPLPPTLLLPHTTSLYYLLDTGCLLVNRISVHQTTCPRARTRVQSTSPLALAPGAPWSRTRPRVPLQLRTFHCLTIFPTEHSVSSLPVFYSSLLFLFFVSLSFVPDERYSCLCLQLDNCIHAISISSLNPRYHPPFLDPFLFYFSFIPTKKTQLVLCCQLSL